MTSFLSPDLEFIDSIRYLMKKIENSMKDTPKYDRKSDVMEGYLELLAFVRIYEFYGEPYVTNLIRHEDDDVSLTLQCLDASTFLLDTIENKSYGTIFFSATLYPIDYYMTLLSKKKGETLKIQSPFPKENLKLMLMRDISTRYQDRLDSIHHVKEIILHVISSKIGNYIAFFPSYQYLNMVLEQLPPYIKERVIVQERDMNLLSRDLTIDKFKNNPKESQLGLFVMGGMFSEGIDYIGDMLHGVVIVGVGLPMLSPQNNQLKDYYQHAFQKGFDYAYTYPGMNKVIQAVGRVIRSMDDRGVAVLIDDRFLTPKYKKLFPNEWKVFDVIRKPEDIIPRLDLFWSKLKEVEKND
jgi:DNA excision repair protein ERCC-2